ncbi:uncharacterized protein [Asterias amurensis]|uniref:uncharacterized protein n=1 Tax=Asterias amurensis TaxID=7602 RepID=UPI003AB13246
MMSMRSKQQRQAQTTGSRYDRMAAPGHVSMNSGVNWSEFAEERKGGNQLPAIGSSGLNHSIRKRAPLSTADFGTSDRYTILPEIDGIDIDKELRESLSAPLKDVSRQRLRAIRISFRRLGNTDNRVSTKDILVVLGEHNVRISNRTYQMIIRKFETAHGVDYEGLWTYMVEAQSKTGRDSIQAINQNKQTTPQPIQQLDAADIALVASISKALKTSSEYDLEEMRAVCQMRDISRHGQLPRKMFRRICLDQHIPLGATLMRTMLKRCDDEKNGLISWPEFIMLLEKGSNLTPEQIKTPTKKPPSAVYKPQLSQKKPLSPKASLHLPSNDTKHKAGTKPRPKSTNGPGKDSKSKETVDNSSEKPLDAQDASTGNVPETKDNLKASDAAVSKQPAGSKVKSKESPVKPKMAQKVKQDEDTLSIKSLPAQRKGKVITWNSPITVPLDLTTASTEQGQSSNGPEEEASKTPNPTESVDVVETSDKLENDDTKTIRSEASLDLDERPEFESLEQGVGSEPMDATEQEYLQKAQQRVNNNSGSEITLNDPSSENSSAISDPKDEVLKAGDSSRSSKDDDAVSVAPSETMNNTDILNAAESNLEDVGGSETSSVLDRDETESQKSLQLQQPIKPKGKPSTPNEKKMRAVYGKNHRRLAPSPLAKKEKKLTPTGRTAAAKKVPSARKPKEVKTNKMKSSTSVRGEAKTKKENPVEPVVASPPATVERSDSNLQELDVETKSIVSQSSNDSRDHQVLPKVQSSPSPSLNGDLFNDDGEDSLSQHLLEVEKANNPVLEEIVLASAEDPEEIPESPPPPPKEEDGETASFVIRGQEVSYYKPDAYVGKETSTEGPSQTLELDWIYGYRGNDCRCNLWAIEDGVLVYFIGKVAILYNSEDHTQRHYTQHTAEIKSLAVHSSNVIMATGQTAGLPETGHAACIHVWSAETLETLYTAGEGYFEKAVLCLNFCKQEDYLVAVDDSDEHTMSIWHSSSGERLADSVLLTEVVCQVAFHPTNPNQLVSVGKEHLCFWQLQKDPYTIEETMIANYETKMKAKYVICLTFHPNGALLTGDSNGTIYLWHKDGNTIAHTITHAHNGPVFWLMYTKNTLISGGRDGIVQTYSLTSKGTDFTGKIQLPHVEGGVRTIQIYKDNMYIGTTLNCILSANVTLTSAGPLVTGATINNAPITQGHYDEVHCIATHPIKNNHFFTAAYDGIVCLYDASLHKALWKYVVKGINATCMDVGQNGEIIVLGAKDGNLVVLTIGEEEVQETNRIKLGRQQINFIKFAPGGEIFAAACHDAILILKVVESGKTLERLGSFEGHSTAVTAFDWSTDDGSGKMYLQSSSVSHEYLCWDVESCKMWEYSSDYRNTSWISQHCLSGYTRAGVWGTSEESAFVNSIDRNEDQCLLVSGTDDGVMSLFKYPCSNQESGRRSIQAHCKDAPIVRFLPGGRMVLSAGGSDCSTVQWIMKG